MQIQDNLPICYQRGNQSTWSKRLEGLGIAGRLGLESLLLTHVSQLIIQWIDYRLEGSRDVFR